MVDSIKGPGGKTIIHIKPPAKEKTEKTQDGDFQKKLKDRGTTTTDHEITTRPSNPAERNLQILHQQQLSRMQRLEALARQINDGTYKMVDPAVLADRLYQIITDKKTRDRFIKKFLDEEKDAKGEHAAGSSLSDLELKQLIFKIKGMNEEDFTDPELEALLEKLV